MRSYFKIKQKDTGYSYITRFLLCMRFDPQHQKQRQLVRNVITNNREREADRQGQTETERQTGTETETEVSRERTLKSKQG